MSELITRQCAEGVLELTLNRPEKKNALNRDLYLALTELLQQAAKEPEVKVVLLSGAGDSFCAGHDIADLVSAGNEAESARVPLRLLQALAGFEKPLVAAVQGHAAGIGATLLLHCDLVYGADNVRLQLPFARMGLVPEGGSSLLLPQLVGHRKAFELLVLGEPFDAHCGCSIGLINEVVPVGEVLARARERAQSLSALPEQAVRQSKHMLRAHQQNLLQQVLVEEIDAFRERLDSAQARAALTAFMQRT